jgi:hypothetical protein
MWFYDVQKRAGDARARPDSVETLMNVVQLDPSKPQEQAGENPMDKLREKEAEVSTMLLFSFTCLLFAIL